MLNVHNDDPAHLVMNLRTLIDHVIQKVTSAKEEMPSKQKKENSRGMLILKLFLQKLKHITNKSKKFILIYFLFFKFFLKKNFFIMILYFIVTKSFD